VQMSSPPGIQTARGFGEAPLIGDGGGGAVEFGDGDGKLLVVAGRAVLKDAKSDSIAQQDRLVRVAAVMNAGVDAVTKADVVCEPLFWRTSGVPEAVQDNVPRG